MIVTTWGSEVSIKAYDRATGLVDVEYLKRTGYSRNRRMPASELKADGGLPEIKAALESAPAMEVIK